jgi:hypothetical protein
VSRIDPLSNTVTEQFTGVGGDCISTGFRSIWLSNHELAVKTTERISHLVLVDSVGIKAGDRESRDIADIYAVTDRQLAELVYVDPKTMARDPKALPESELTLMARSREATGRYAWTPYMHDPKLKGRLHRIRIPTLVLWGAADLVARPAVIHPVGAVDYLLKPVDAGRLRETISRAIDRLDRDDLRASSVKAVRSAAAALESSTPLRRIPVRKRDEIVLVAVDQVASVLANGELQLRSQRSLPMSEAAEAHRLLEEEGVREKLLLTTAAVGSRERSGNA